MACVIPGLLTHFVKTLIVRSYLKMKRASHRSFSTTTTCGTKMCKLSFKFIWQQCFWSCTCAILTPNKPCRHSGCVAGKCAAFSVLLVAADPNLQRLHVLGISIHSRNTRFQDAAVDSMAPLLVPVTQRGTEIMKCWCRPCTCSVAPGDAHLCCLLLGGVQSRAPHIAALQSDLGGVQQKTCLLWK